MTQHRREIDPQVEDFKKLVERMEHVVMNAREQVPDTFSELFGDMQKRDKDTNKRIDDFHEVFKNHLVEDIKFKDEDLRWKTSLSDSIQPIVDVYKDGGRLKNLLKYLAVTIVTIIVSLVSVLEGIPRIIKAIKGF